MGTETFVRRTRIDAPAEEVFRWHTQPDAFEKLIPPWANVKVLRREGGIKDGAQTELEVNVGPYKGSWLLEHRDYKEGEQFSDQQIRGPFAAWCHLHRMEPDGAEACYLEDRVDFKLPAGPLGKLIADSFIRHKLERLFEYRHQVIQREFQQRSAGPPSAPTTKH